VLTGGHLGNAYRGWLICVLAVTGITHLPSTSQHFYF